MASLTMTLLGGFDVRLSSGASLSLPSRKAQALLAYLGARPAESHPRDKLAALLWGDKRDAQARGGLRHALVAIRRALASAVPPPLKIHGQLLGLDPEAIDVDVAVFERLVAAGTPSALETAAELYRGDLLLGFSLSEPLFEDWLVAERERLREMALEVLARLLAQQSKTPSTERAIQTAVRLLALDPLQETVHRALMRLYARQGRRGAALKQYQVCLGILQRELGTEPEAETRTLYQEILRKPDDREKRAPSAAPGRTLPSPAAVPDLAAPDTPFVGRRAEIERLRRALEEAVRGQGRIVSVTGEAGIGKTRLVSRLVTDALARGCRALIGRCHESDTILPFGPWVDACRSGGISADAEILGALHAARRAELTRLFPEAGEGGLPPAGTSALPLFESLADLIEQVAVRRPLVLVLEDLHWADEMSLRLLAFVGRRLPAWRALVIVTAREDELADAARTRHTLEDLARAPQATAVTLAPLTRGDTASLVRALGGLARDASALARVEEQVWAMSEGNPFVAVETVRALGSEPLALPASVRGLVSRRLDRLTARAQQLAAVAAIIGRRFEFTLLHAASGVEEAEAAVAVEEMVRHRVLQAVGDRLDFTHDRLREVIYGRLLAPRRRLLHRAVADALEAGGAAGGEGERIEELAHHALGGELFEKAARYLTQAGTRAAARSALQDARAWFERALDVLATLPESRPTLEQSFDVRLALRPMLSQLGELDANLRRLHEAEALAERLGDDGRRGHVYAFLTNLHARLGETSEAIASGGRALEIAQRLGDLRMRIVATTFLAQAHYYRGDFERVVELARDNLAVLPPEWAGELLGLSQTAAVNDRTWLVQALAHLGRFSEAEGHVPEMLRLAEAARHPYTLAVASQAAGVLHVIKGEWLEAVSHLEREVAVVRAGGIVDPLPIALAYSARALAHAGDTPKALQRIRETEEVFDAQPSLTRPGNAGWIYYSAARASLEVGRLDEAMRFADRGSELTSGRVDFGPHTEHLRGELASYPDRLDAARAEAHFRSALAVAMSRGMRPLIAHCHAGLATLHARTGKHSQGREHCETAAAMYRDMGMRAYLERLESDTASLRRLDVPGSRRSRSRRSTTHSPCRLR